MWRLPIVLALLIPAPAAPLTARWAGTAVVVTWPRQAADLCLARRVQLADGRMRDTLIACVSGPAGKAILQPGDGAQKPQPGDRICRFLDPAPDACSAPLPAIWERQWLPLVRSG